MESTPDSETHSHNFTLRRFDCCCCFWGPPGSCRYARVTLNFCQWANGYCSARVRWLVQTQLEHHQHDVCFFSIFFFSDLNVQKIIWSHSKIYLFWSQRSIVRTLIPRALLKLKTLRGYFVKIRGSHLCFKLVQNVTLCVKSSQIPVTTLSKYSSSCQSGLWWWLALLKQGFKP